MDVKKILKTNNTESKFNKWISNHKTPDALRDSYNAFIKADKHKSASLIFEALRAKVKDLAKAKTDPKKPV